MKQELQVLLSHESKEWYTPSEYVELARQVMGKIDLDPASNELAQQWIKAKRYFTVKDDGLLQPWYGKVWLNPPYGKTQGKSNQELWSKKLVKEYQAGNVTEAILLTKASLGYKWFDNLLKCWPVCFMYGLIRFIKPDSTQTGKAKLGSTFFYFGDNLDQFETVFNTIGLVVKPEKPQSEMIDLFSYMGVEVG